MIKCTKAIADAINGTLASVNSVWTITKKYRSYNKVWYDITNGEDRLNITEDIFNNNFKEVA